MTHSLLQLLCDRYAFDATPRFDDLGVYHVPFESMGADLSVETRLREGVLRGERIALIAESGCGKSSAISHVLGPTAEGVYPIIVPVHSLMERAVSAETVADMVMAQLASDPQTAQVAELAAAGASGTQREVTQSAKRFRRLCAQAPAGVLRGELSQEIARQVTTSQQIPFPEKVEVISQCLVPMHEVSLMPVIIFDDTDRWSASGEEGIVEGFFGQAIRWLTDLHTAVVVATHSRYLEAPQHGGTLLRFLDSRVRLPRLPSAHQLARILTERVHVHLENADAWNDPLPALEEVVTESAIHALFEQCTNGVSLRRIIQVAHIALAEATDAGAEVMTEHHIVAASQA